MDAEERKDSLSEVSVLRQELQDYGRIFERNIKGSGTMQNEMYQFYLKNQDFKRYIDECVKTYGKDIQYMLSTRIAEEYYKSLLKGGCNANEKTQV